MLYLNLSNIETQTISNRPKFKNSHRHIEQAKQIAKWKTWNDELGMIYLPVANFWIFGVVDDSSSLEVLLEWCFEFFTLVVRITVLELFEIWILLLLTKDKLGAKGEKNEDDT